MKRLGLSFLFTLWIAFSSFASQDYSEIVKKMLPGIVVVYAENDGDKSSQGSGFFVTSKGDVITNFHVVEGMQVFGVKTNDGQIHQAWLRAYDKQRDMALLMTKIPSSNFKVMSLSPEIPPIGTAVFAIGAPIGLEKSVSDGLVSQVHKIRGIPFLQISCPISSGSSGGPVLNTKGEIVGMATLTLTLQSSQNLNFAIPSPALKTFIEYGKDRDIIQNLPVFQTERQTPQKPSKSKSQSPTTFEDRYVHMSTEEDGTKTLLDTRSIKQTDQIVSFWIIDVLSDKGSKIETKSLKLKNVKIVAILEYIEIDFVNEKFRIPKMLYRGDDNVDRNSSTPDLTWERLNPTSAISQWYDYVVKNYLSK